MKHFLQTLGEIISGSGRPSPLELVTIDHQQFAIAHSREEMKKLMRMRDGKVAGYILQHRM